MKPPAQTMNNLLPVSCVYDLLRTVDDPEIGINIVDLGFIYGVVSEPGSIRILMSLTTNACPMRNTILDWVSAVLRAETDQEILIDTDSSPEWTPARINPEAFGSPE